MKVRKAGRPLCATAKPSSLQWGRTREGAEGKQHEDGSVEDDAVLQWGRTREGAEGKSWLEGNNG